MSRTKTNRPALETAIVDALDAADEPMTNAEIWQAIHPAALTDTTTRHVLRDLVKRGRVRQVTVSREVLSGFDYAGNLSRHLTRVIRTTGFTTTAADTGERGKPS